MKLTDRKWMPFKLGDVCTIEKGVRLTKANMRPGNRPFVGATSSNNGITNWVSNTNGSLDRNVLGVNYNGSVGYAFYHPYECIFTDDVKRLHLKNHKDGRRVLQFFAVAIAQQAKNHDYGYKFNGERMERQNIMLPVNAEGKPDYAFMEAYIRERENALLTRYRAFVKGRTIPCRGGVRLHCRAVWRPFRLLDYFDYRRGDQKDMNSLSSGREMLVSARNVENGLKGFYSGAKTHRRFAGNCLTLNNDGDGGVGLSYYQPNEFLLDTHVYALYPKKPISKFAQLFVSRSISMCRPCFSHGHSISQGRLKTLKIMLPATTDGKPDFTYMDEYGREVMLERLEKYLAYRSATA